MMDSKLSTDELFHFTYVDRLINIIKEGFYPRYNLEHTFLSDLFSRPSVVELIPMVCFCDIPLNLVQEHSSKYGNCAIGLDKKWGVKYGLSPVIYVDKNSRIADAISAIANSFSNYKASMIADGSDISIYKMISNFAKGLTQLSHYIKQYERIEDENCFINNRLCTFKKGRFYDEREWRYVPSLNRQDSFWLLDVNILDNEEELNKANEKLKRTSLKFEIDDLKYIVCKTTEEKEKLTSALGDRFKIDTELINRKINIHMLNEI